MFEFVTNIAAVVWLFTAVSFIITHSFLNVMLFKLVPTTIAICMLLNLCNVKF